MEKLKIAEVITRMDWGGSSDIVRIICSYLSEQGHQVTLILGKTTNLTKVNGEFLHKFRERIIYIPYLIRNINPFYDLLAFIKLCLIFKKERFDIVHTHTAKAGVLGRIAAYLCGDSKIIHMPHGHNFYGYFSPFMSWLIILIERLCATFTDKIVTLTNLTKNDYVSLNIKNKDDILIVPSGLERERLEKVYSLDKAKKKKELGLNDEDLIIGMVSRLEPVKGPQYFIESAIMILKEAKYRVKFLIVGEGTLRGELEELSQKLNLKDKIIFLGWRDDVYELLYILDILVQPSLNEAVGRIILEAQALGVAVIATSVGGIPEIIEDKKTGLLVPSKDGSALARAIIYLLDNERLRREIIRKAKDNVRDKFSSEKMIKDILRVYENVLS